MMDVDQLIRISEGERTVGGTPAQCMRGLIP
jgi:hypothetical protein